MIFFLVLFVSTVQDELLFIYSFLLRLALMVKRFLF